jgi:hypothetical protein
MSNYEHNWQKAVLSAVASACLADDKDYLRAGVFAGFCVLFMIALWVARFKAKR